MNGTRASDELYMQFPLKNNNKKNPQNHQCVCIYIHVYIPLHSHHIRTWHTHTPPTVTLSASHLRCSPLAARLFQPDKFLRSYDMRKKRSAWLPALPARRPVCLFIFLSPWEKLQSPKVLQHQGRASSPRCRRLAAPWPLPPPGCPCLRVRRQRPAAGQHEGCDTDTLTLTHPPK